MTAGDLRQRQGRSAAARQAYQEALSIIDGVAASLRDAAQREIFLGSSRAVHIRQLAQATSARDHSRT